jgi:fatty-acyl-CoA synthase
MGAHNGLTIASQTLRALRRYPDSDAFVWEGGKLSYAAAFDLIGRMQAVFARNNFRRTERVAILSENSAESWCAGVAAQGLGLSITWLHPKGSLDDQVFQITNSEAAIFIADPGGHAERARELCAKLPPELKRFALGSSDFADDLIAAASSIGSSSPVDIARPDDGALVHYTGGTTGRSKGAVRSNNAAVAFASFSALADLELPTTPRYLALAPNSHAGGTMLLPTWRRGGTVHLARKFDPPQILERIAREGINFTFIVPTMLYALLDEPTLSKANVSSLEYLFYGAAPAAPARLVEAIERIGPVLAQGYGQTECYPISVLRRQDHDPCNPELLSSCGIPVATCEVKLLDSDGNEVAPGEAGEICARTPAAMDGYWRLPDLTAETLAGGWVHTGDVARMDDRGYLYIVDRKKDLIISGGFNVYPREVEDALTDHASVAMAAVVGIPDDHWGEAVVAAVVLRAGSTIEPQALISHVKQRKGSVHAPKRIAIVEKLPTTALGKIDKVALRRNLRG